MTDNLKRRRFPAFSIRTLLIVMTLLCAYAACWPPTKTRGVADVNLTSDRDADDQKPLAEFSGRLPRTFSFRQLAEAVAPLLISVNVRFAGVDRSMTSRRYYFWFFGYVAQLPFERKIPQPRNDDSGLIKAGPSI